MKTQENRYNEQNQPSKKIKNAKIDNKDEPESEKEVSRLLSLCRNSILSLNS